MTAGPVDVAVETGGWLCFLRESKNHVELCVLEFSLGDFLSYFVQSSMKTDVFCFAFHESPVQFGGGLFRGLRDSSLGCICLNSHSQLDSMFKVLNGLLNLIFVRCSPFGGLVRGLYKRLFVAVSKVNVFPLIGFLLSYSSVWAVGAKRRVPEHFLNTPR